MASEADEIRQVVAELLKAPEMAALLGEMRAAEGEASPPVVATAAPPTTADHKGMGIFRDIDSAVGAAMVAQRELVDLPLETRRSIIAAMRRAALDNNESLSSEAVAETGLGNVRDKLAKNELAATRTPGVEDLEPRATTDEHGLTLTEPAPWGRDSNLSSPKVCWSTMCRKSWKKWWYCKHPESNSRWTTSEPAFHRWPT